MNAIVVNSTEEVTRCPRCGAADIVGYRAPSWRFFEQHCPACDLLWWQILGDERTEAPASELAALRSPIAPQNGRIAALEALVAQLLPAGTK